MCTLVVTLCIGLLVSKRKQYNTLLCLLGCCKRGKDRCFYSQPRLIVQFIFQDYVYYVCADIPGESRLAQC